MCGNNDYKIPQELVFVTDLTLKGKVEILFIFLLDMFLAQRLGNIIEKYQRSYSLPVTFVMGFKSLCLCVRMACDKNVRVAEPDVTSMLAQALRLFCPFQLSVAQIQKTDVTLIC